MVPTLTSSCERELEVLDASMVIKSKIRKGYCVKLIG